MEHGTGDRIAQDLSKASFFHKRVLEDSRIDWTWPARDLVNLVRAQAGPYPNAFAYAGAERLRVLSVRVSRQRCGGTAGRIFQREGDGVIIVCGPEARRGANHGVVLERLRADDDRELAAGDWFEQMGGYLQLPSRARGRARGTGRLIAQGVSATAASGVATRNVKLSTMYRPTASASWLS